MRMMCAAGISLALGLFVAIADDKKPADTKNSRAEKLAALQKKYDKELDELKKRFSTAKSDEDRRGIRDEARELTVLTARDVMKIAEEDPKDETGFNAASFILNNAGMIGAGKELDAAVSILGEHHLNNPKVKEFLPRIAFAGPAAQKFLLLASDKATDKEVKGLALFYLGIEVTQQLDDEEDTKKIDELINKATGFFRRAEKEAPDAKVGTTTIGKEVTSQLEGMQAIKNLAIGKPVPDIEGTDLGGKKIKLSSYKGKVVLLDIWATWCPPCRAMIPHEREMVKKLKGKPFALLSVSADNEQDTLIKFFEKEPMPWDHWFDGQGGAVTKAFRVRAFPTLYLIDHTGVIRNKWVGNPGDEKLEKAVEDLVKEAERPKG